MTTPKDRSRSAEYVRCPGCRCVLSTEGERRLGCCYGCVGATDDEVAQIEAEAGQK